MGRQSARARVCSFGLAACFVVQVVMPSVAHADPVPQVDAESREKSRAAFRKGVAQLRAQDWGAARASFESAWSLYPHPSILLNLGIARLRTDDPVRAEQDFIRFLSEDFGASPEELAGAREALAEVRGKLGTLKVRVMPASARVVVDGRQVETVRRADVSGAAVAELRTKPGRHAIAVDAEGFVAAQKDVDVPAKTEVSAAIDLAPVAATKPPPPVTPEESDTRTIVGWSLLGVAGAATATTIVAGLRASSLASDYNDAQGPRFQDPDAKSSGITFRTTADIALGVGIAAAAVGLVLLLTDLGKSSKNAAGQASAATPFGPPVLHW